MCDILVSNSALDALMDSDLALFPIAPNGEFYNSLPNSLFSNPQQGSKSEGYLNLIMTSYLNRMTCQDIRGIVSSEYHNPFVIAKTINRHSLHPNQIYAFAQMILGGSKITTPFSLFIENIFGIERPSEYSGCVLIDTPPTDMHCEVAKHAFANWGGTVIFVNN